jgi:hypothetical protein
LRTDRIAAGWMLEPLFSVVMLNVCPVWCRQIRCREQIRNCYRIVLVVYIVRDGWLGMLRRFKIDYKAIVFWADLQTGGSESVGHIRGMSECTRYIATEKANEVEDSGKRSLFEPVVQKRSSGAGGAGRLGEWYGRGRGWSRGVEGKPRSYIALGRASQRVSGTVRSEHSQKPMRWIGHCGDDRRSIRAPAGHGHGKAAKWKRRRQGQD